MTITEAMIRYRDQCDSFICKYFRGVITVWRVGSGWLGLIAKVSLVISMFLTEISTKQRYSTAESEKLALIAIILSGVCFLCQVLHDYGRDAMDEHKKILNELQRESDRNQSLLLTEIRDNIQKSQKETREGFDEVRIRISGHTQTCST